MKFKFKAQKTDGQIVSGEKEAPDKFKLYDALRADGLTLISTTSKTDKKSGPGFMMRFKNLFARLSLGTVPIHQKIIFMKNIGAMMDAGLSLSKSLIVIERQIRNKALKQVAISLNESVKKGKPLSQGLEKFPHIFSNLVVSIVRAGEEGGNLSEALRIVTIQLERFYYIKRKVRGALMYPAVIICLIIVIGIVMMVYVVPKLTETFKDIANLELPMSTKAIIAISDFLKVNYGWVLLGLLAFGSFIFYFAKTPQGKKFFDLFYIRIPIIGEMIKETNSARTARTISSLLGSGVNLINTLEITADVVQNIYFKKVILKAKDAMQKGTNLSEVFGEDESIYPPFFVEMVSAGEETGNISGMLLDVAVFYENEIDQKTKDLSTLLEPLIMVVIGVAVGFFAYAMLTPMYSMMGSIG